jgi:flavin reductase (DIM6/NTAB) family NADH-FMN oxidoreductase RutF
VEKVCVEGVGKFYQHYPALAAVVTARLGEKANAMAAAWHSSLSGKPPLYGVAISPKRFTHDLILEAGEFGVNFLPFDRAGIIAAVGGSTGREVDKFEAFKIAEEKPVLTSVPILQDAYATYECKLVSHHTFGDHTWFVGEILMVHLLEEALTEEGVLNLERVTPALYLGADLYLSPSPESVLRLDREVYGKVE